MKKLYLIRHAKSSWKNPDLADFDRPLNRRGKKNAPYMGRRLKKFKVKPDMILASPAKRALKTAELIAKEIGFPRKQIATDALLYESDLLTLVDAIKKIDDSFSCVMMFGHNPALTDLAEYLTNHKVDRLPTCGIFSIDFSINSWKEISNGKGAFNFVDYPQ